MLLFGIVCSSEGQSAEGWRANIIAKSLFMCMNGSLLAYCRLICLVRHCYSSIDFCHAPASTGPNGLGARKSNLRAPRSPHTALHLLLPTPLHPVPSRSAHDAVESCSSRPPGWLGGRIPVRTPLPPPKSKPIDKLTLHNNSPAVVALPTLQNANYATLREIEGRLKSIKNISKITKTMKIVASTKLTRAQRAMEAAKKYGATSQQVFDEAETKEAEDSNEKTLLVVCSSDKGLCGGVHSGLSRAARKMLNEKPNDYDIVVLGEKCKAQLSRSNAKQIVLSFSGIGKNVPTFADAGAIADQISLLPTEYKNTKVLYNKFINAQSYQPIAIDAYNEETISQSRAYSPLAASCSLMLMDCSQLCPVRD